MGRCMRLRPASLHCQLRGSVLVPVNLFGLPEEIEALGERWAVKDEFHVTAGHAPFLAERAGVSLDGAWGELAAAVEGRRAGPVRVSDELRVAREDEERTLLVMTSVDGLGELYTELAGRVGVPLAPPPTHITLYTRPDGKGIGLHEYADLRSMTRALTDAEAAEVRAATGWG